MVNSNDYGTKIYAVILETKFDSTRVEKKNSRKKQKN